MFSIGDYIIYGGTGACRVENIGPLSGSKDNRQYYSLAPVYGACAITVPVDSQKIFMRPVISREEANRVIDLIPTIHPQAYHNRVLRQLSEHYEQAIKSYDCEELLRLVMSIYTKKQEMEAEKRHFGAVDERYMMRGEELLHGELAVALGIDVGEVKPYIRSRLKSL
jgi:CarD family transcriptional regulator